MANVEIYQDNSDPPEWRWRVTASGTVIGKSSEGFARKTYAENNFRSLPQYCRPVDVKAAADNTDVPEGERVLPLEFYEDQAGQWRWRIVARNGRIVHASDQGWDSKDDAVSNLEGLVSTATSWSGP
jgi:uncharacterized protein YegP (UPF0339 family)